MASAEGVTTAPPTGIHRCPVRAFSASPLGKTVVMAGRRSTAVRFNFETAPWSKPVPLGVMVGGGRP